jgi:hypothetical protein
MLTINIITREKLIEELTGLKGVLPTNTYLISINGLDELPVIPSKKNILSIDYFASCGPDAIKYKDIINLYNFSIKVILENAKTKDIFLFIQSTNGGNRAFTIATFISELIPKEFLNSEIMTTTLAKGTVDMLTYLKLVHFVFAKYWNNEVLPF